MTLFFTIGIHVPEFILRKTPRGEGDGMGASGRMQWLAYVILYFENMERPLTGASIGIKVKDPSQKFIVILVISTMLLYNPLERCLIMSKIMIMGSRIKILDKGVGFPK